MKTLIPFLFFISLASCTSSSVKNFRTPSSQTELQGTYLGVASYKGKLRRPAVRIYLNETPGESDTYHVVLLEYVNLLGILPKYILSNKSPKISNVIGFLNKIVKKITVYKAIPSDKAYHYNLFELQADSRTVKTVESSSPRQLVLSNEKNLSYPLEGAYITQNKKGQAKKIFFPVEKSIKNHGPEYNVAKLVYDKVGLDSTWRKNFLAGPYLSAYGKKNDVVLDLVSEKANRAYFSVKSENSYKTLSKSKRKRKKREDVFTNPKSAFLEGGFIMREPVDGMFVLSPTHSNKSADTIEELNGRIGLFIDIFDATKKLNQDVVELILINPSDPLDFHMHYEDPDNGEGD
jgi:hypothetical protein